MSFEYKVILNPGNKSIHDLGEHTYRNPVHRDDELHLTQGVFIVTKVMHLPLGSAVLRVDRVNEPVPYKASLG